LKELCLARLLAFRRLTTLSPELVIVEFIIFSPRAATFGRASLLVQSLVILVYFKLLFQFLRKSCSWVSRYLELKRLLRLLLLLDNLIDGRFRRFYIEEVSECFVLKINNIESRTPSISGTLGFSVAVLSLFANTHSFNLFFLILVLLFTGFFEVLELFLESKAALLHILELQLKVLLVLPLLHLNVFDLSPLSV
jgi:hypothetical protein